MFLQYTCFILLVGCVSSRWSEDKANQWYSKYEWAAGVNYVPAYAVNEL